MVLLTHDTEDVGVSAQQQMNSLKCPTCGSFDIKANYQLHVGRWDKNGKVVYSENGEEKWTTRKFREQNNLQPDQRQILVVPPGDWTWNTCGMCGTEFDENGNIYENSL